MIRLGVNIDHVATIRQARRAAEPDPVAAAILAVLGGADGITIHLREDRRHIQDRDLLMLSQIDLPRLNLEMATVDAIIDLAIQTKPAEATLVPEKRQELTTEGGLDVIANEQPVRRAIDRLKSAGIHVSLFIDPNEAQIEASSRFGADAIEFQTASYSEARGADANDEQLSHLHLATQLAREHKLHVHAGHGLNYHNVQAVCAIPGIEELNIGHSIVSRAVLVGIERAVREMKQAMVAATA